MHYTFKLISRTVIGLSLFCLAGCYKVTIRPTGVPVPETQPQYSESQDFFLFGLIGEKHIDVGAICKGAPVQLQTQHTFVNQLLSIVTIGIYTPATAKVWCS